MIEIKCIRYGLGKFSLIYHTREKNVSIQLQLNSDKIYI